MKCEIISIGNELLIGDTVNTNAAWLGRFLTDHGIEVTQIHTIADDLDLVKKTIGQSLNQSGLVITTGGLGPTHDDMTKKAIRQLFDVNLVLHKPTLKFIKKIFEKRNIPFSKSNYHQAEVPENCEVLFNKQGTAPGMWFEEGGSRLAVLPGVPFEMKQLMQNKVLPKIKELTGEAKYHLSRYIVTAGVGESTLSDELLGELDRYFSDDLSVAFLPDPHGTRIRISGYGTNLEKITERMEPVAAYIYEKASEVIIGEGKEYELSEAVGDVLREKQLTIATAESCTGGLLADTLTNIPGSSDYMEGGVIAYANNIKMKLLGVNEESIIAHGAVSKETALQMAKGVAEKLGTDIGISTTGIAGPGGGTPDKPVGTVWIGYWSNKQHFALNTVLSNDRLINKDRSVAIALETIRRSILGIQTLPYGLNPYSV